MSTKYGDFKDLASAVESVSKILAVVVGATWAYFKFIKDRIYRPRLDVSIDGGTLEVGADAVLICRLSVENIGTSKVQLVQRGTGLRLSIGSRSDSYAQPSWKPIKVYEVLDKHAWIESGETVRHELVVSLPADLPDLLLLEARLVCKTPRKSISVYANRVLPSSTPWEESAQMEGPS